MRLPVPMKLPLAVGWLSVAPADVAETKDQVVVWQWRYVF